LHQQNSVSENHLNTNSSEEETKSREQKIALNRSMIIYFLMEGEF